MGEVVHVLTVVDGQSEELLDILVLTNFELEQFRLRFDVPDTDPDMRDRYGVGPDHTAFLAEVTGQELVFEFGRYAYFIEAAERK